MATPAGQRLQRIPLPEQDYDLSVIDGGGAEGTSSFNEFDDLIIDLDEVGSAGGGEGDSEGGAKRNRAVTEGVDLEDALTDLRYDIGRAVDFMENEFYPDWERAEEFYSGDTDLPIQAGRSQVTQTVLRDAVRSAKPNAMRVFLQSPEMVEYEPSEILNHYASTIAFQQTKFANQTFWKTGGYSLVLNAVHNSFLKKFSVSKAFYQKSVTPEYMKATGLTPDQLMVIEQLPDVQITSAEADETGLYDIEVASMTEGGEVRLDSVNLLHFFINDSATCADDADVIGERSDITVSEAISMGLEYDDWLELSPYDPETNDGMGESEARRGYVIDHAEQSNSSDDVSRHKFLLTEAYAYFDLDGTGVSQLYRFFLGGTEMDYLDHERVEENPYAISQCDPQPDTFAGKSLYDVLKEDQNTQTSILRATCDNAHASNNRRLAYHETMVNSKDLNSTVLGHPIRFRQPGMIQEIGVTSTLGSMLPLLQHLDVMSQQKAGTTNAAMGLDPDALQSTDKDAVKNTIQLAQGQIEFMVRNIAETGMVPLFNKLLRLSIRHNPQHQVIRMTGGRYVPVDQYMFTTDIPIKARVGLGMPDIQTKMMGLDRIAAKQEEVIAQFGFSNPLCSLDNLYNTYIDLADLAGLSSFGRYFNEVTPEGIQQLTQQAAQAAEAARQEKPSEGIIAAETIRAQARVQEQQLENDQRKIESDRDTRIKMIETLMKDDLERDKLAQSLEVDSAKIKGTEVNQAYVEYEQQQDRRADFQKFLIQELAKERAEQQRAQMAKQQAQQSQNAGPMGVGPQSGRQQ